mgnify:CR=1 FL=1
MFVSVFVNLLMYAQSQLIGSTTDNGCIVSAGYQWCSQLNRCIRPWLTQCPQITIDPGYQYPSRPTIPHPIISHPIISHPSDPQTLTIGSVCYEFCEDNSHPLVNHMNDCPIDSICSNSHTSMYNYDSCGARAWTCMALH